MARPIRIHADGWVDGQARGSAGVLRALYGALLWLLTPLYVARLWWRGRREPLYRHAIGQRLGFGLTPEAPGAIWVHAVSLGETRAAAPLLAALRAAQPGRPLLLTSTTATGWAAAEALLAPGDRHAWLPYDTPGAVRRFLRAQRPAVGVLMETEVWPVLLHEARRVGLPMVLASARLSEKSARKAARLAWLLRPAARALTRTLAQTEADAQRLRAAGASDVSVAGNLKFDLTPDPAQQALGERWRAALGARPVVLAASTREGPPGEEAALLAAWRAAHPPGAPAPLLVIVPRHPPRFDAVAALIVASSLRLARRSLDETPGPETEVWLGDTVGEMAAWYTLADAALLGGSFAPHGGQNLIEAAACGCPLIMGPSTFNFAQAAHDTIAAGAAWRVADWDEGLRLALSLTKDPARRAEASASALAFTAAHRGAAARMAAAIVQLL